MCFQQAAQSTAVAQPAQTETPVEPERDSESLIARRGDGTKIFAYAGDPNVVEEATFILTPFDTLSGETVFGVDINPGILHLAAFAKQITNTPGIAFDEHALRAVARIFNEAADHIVAENDPQRAVQLGEQGHGIC